MPKVDNIGAIIKAVVEKRGMHISEFGRRINSTRENVYSIYQRKSIDTALLSKISTVLEHDFFQYYSSIAQENEQLKKDVEMFKNIIEVLQKK